MSAIFYYMSAIFANAFFRNILYNVKVIFLKGINNMYSIDLSGNWHYETDPNDIGISEGFFGRTLKNEGFTIPADACFNKVGKRFVPFEEFSYEAVRTLRPHYEYIGALWLQREFTLPEEYENKYITLFLERVNIASDLWIDGIKIDRQIIEITTPHIYNLTDKIKAGTHTVTLRIDNRNLLNIDGMASGYSVDTQSIWNGIIGKTEIRCEEIFHTSNIQVFPDERSIKIKLTAHSDCLFPKETRNVSFEIYAFSPDGTKLKSEKYSSVLFTKKQILHFDYPIDNPLYWDEFNPVLYTLHVKMTHKNTVDEQEASFGMRTICTKGSEFILNGKPIALRGTADSGIYPITGYPPTDIEAWLKTFRTLKEYGLNHMRFHAWCPPEAAFTAADMTGVYVLAEMPLWLNMDVCALSAGDDPIHKTYYLGEAMNISEHFGNHPSFIMFSNGNELLGDFEMLENITTQIKSLDNRRLYTLTSNFERPVTPADDYYSAVAYDGQRVRVQVFHDVVSEHTRLSYDDVVKKLNMPLVSFEIGQYCVYPDVDSTKAYTSNLRPVNFELIKEEMIKHNVYHMLDAFKKASGHFAALMYKEDIEASLRTHKMGGFELLGLSDYTGQGTATVGLLDVFWNSKNIITAEEFRHFCSPVVPLLKADRIFMNTDTFRAELDLYNYSQTDIENPVFDLTLYDGENELLQKTTTENQLSFPLDFIVKPTMVKAVLSVGEYSNSWNIFVYTNDDIKCDIPVFDGITDELISLTKTGGKAIVTMSHDNLAHSFDGLFKPQFWSPAHFPSERSCGLICDNIHRIFDAFPTTAYADFQWKHPIDNCVNTDVSSLPTDFKYIVEPVPHFCDNVRRSPLFEAKVGNADVLFCGFDFSTDNTAVKALENSIYKYVNSDSFVPVQMLTIEEIKKLFK